MKRKLKIILTASTASLLAWAALADPATDTDSPMRQHMLHPSANRLNSAAKASDIIGMTVKNLQDEKLGKVEDLALDVQSGRIVQVILSSGGFLGVGNTLMAVPPGAL